MLRSHSKAEFELAMNDCYSQRKHVTPSNEAYAGQTQSSVILTSLSSEDSFSLALRPVFLQQHSVVRAALLLCILASQRSLP